MNNNIIFSLEDIYITNHDKNDYEIAKILNEFEEEQFKTELNENMTIDNFDNFENIDYYTLKYTLKDLLKICEYYDISKYIKTSKCKKQDIILTLIMFESLPENFEIVTKRQQLWKYMLILTTDKKMRKYVIWN